MFEKNIQKLSLKMNKKNYFKSFGIVLFSLTVTLLLTIMPVITKSLLEWKEINNYLNNINPYLHTVISCLIVFLVAFFACVFYSSVSVGEKAWYSGRFTQKKLCLKRFIFWLRPKYSFKAFRLNILLIFAKLLWLTVFCSPAFITILTAVTLAFTGGVEVYLLASLLLGTIALLIVGLIFTFIFNQRYFLAPYLLAENPKLGVVQVVKQSKNLIEGQLFRVVCFKLTFLPAFVLYPLLLPIIFLYPHYKQSSCIIAKELRI